MNSKRSELRTEIRRVLNETDSTDSMWTNTVLNDLIARKYSYWLKRFVSASPENSNIEVTETLTTSGTLKISEDFGFRHIMEVRDTTDSTQGVTMVWADSWEQLVSTRRSSDNITNITAAPTTIWFSRTIGDHGDMTFPIEGNLEFAPTPSSSRTIKVKGQLGVGRHMKHSDNARTYLPAELEDCLIHDTAIAARLQEQAPKSEIDPLREELNELMKRIPVAARSIRRGPGRIRYYDVD